MLVPWGARDPGRLLCDLNVTVFLRLARRCPARRRGCSVWSLAGWLQAAAGRAVVVSASGWPLRLGRWPGAWYSVGAVEVPAGFPARERAAGLTDRRAERGVLDRLVEAVQAGESRALVAVGEPGVGKTVLLEYLALAARPKKKRKGTTRPGKGRWRAPDLVKRDFPAAAVNVKWYGDGTDIDTDEGKLYLDSVLDVGSRRGLVMAVAVRGGAVPGVIMHTDEGSRRSTPRPTSGPPASGFPSPSPWAGPGRRWITRSSSRGTPPWSSSCGASSTTRPRRRPGPGSRPGSRTTTTTAGTPRWAGSPRWITSGRWRERSPRDRGPAAARPRTRRRRLRRRCPSP